MSTATEPRTHGAPSAIALNIQIYNTLTRRKETFEPVTPGKVGIYLCGPTVYKPRPTSATWSGPVIFDTIKRYLELQRATT